jgi:hypothetical protein
MIDRSLRIVYVKMPRVERAAEAFESMFYNNPSIPQAIRERMKRESDHRRERKGG